jgi:hypothetical protein
MSMGSAVVMAVAWGGRKNPLPWVGERAMWGQLGACAALKRMNQTTKV